MTCDNCTDAFEHFVNCLSESEKEKIMTTVIERANKDQRDLMNRVKEKNHAYYTADPCLHTKAWKQYFRRGFVLGFFFAIMLVTIIFVL